MSYKKKISGRRASENVEDMRPLAKSKRAVTKKAEVINKEDMDGMLKAYRSNDVDLHKFSGKADKNIKVLKTKPKADSPSGSKFLEVKTEDGFKKLKKSADQYRHDSRKTDRLTKDDVLKNRIQDGLKKYAEER